MIEANQSNELDTLVSLNAVQIIDLEGAQLSSITKVADQLKKALSEKGLALLINHGISLDKIRTAWEYFDNFLELPNEVKEQYKRVTAAEGDNHGYISPGMERFDGKTPELRHAFNICKRDTQILPKEIPGLGDHINSLRNDFQSLAVFILQALAVSLDMPQTFFLDNHLHMLSDDSSNLTTLRMLYYPPVVDHTPGQVVRCGAHSDYGTFTLLAQDCEGGLEVKLRDTEKWQRVGHLPGAITINLGETMSLWTQRRYYALPHRVVVPDEDYVRASGRHSFAFFLHPDNMTKIEPRDLLPSENTPEPCNEKIYNAFEIAMDMVKGTYY